METTTLSTKGQLVIPTKFRKALHLRAGDKVAIDLHGDRLVLTRDKPARAKLVKSKFGRMVLAAPSGAPLMTVERIKAILNDDE